MTQARQDQISLEATSYYHCISRCVRRAFLCGEDSLTGQNYDHRKQWVVDRLRELTGVFAIDICAYAVMANHYHVVLRVDEERAKAWTLTEVAAQWGRLFKHPLVVQRYLQDQITSTAERDYAEQVLEGWRERLTNVSWFMRSLNEYLAREANREDGCTGRFWEGRFKSQALLDEVAVLSCMSYVDLNPIRAGLTDNLDESDFTSIQARLRALQDAAETPAEATATAAATEANPQPAPVLPLVRAPEDGHVHALGLTATEYLDLVDWAGRAVRADKRGFIPEQVPPVLERLAIDPAGYLRHVTGQSGSVRSLALGAADKLQAYARQLGQKFIRGQRPGRGLYGEALVSA